MCFCVNDVRVKCRYNGILGINGIKYIFVYFFFFFVRNYIVFEIGVWLYYI